MDLIFDFANKFYIGLMHFILVICILALLYILYLFVLKIIIDIQKYFRGGNSKWIYIF